jgi:hypothetical protein
MQIIKGRTVQHSGVHVGGRSVNASRLERWLGRETTEHLSQNMRDWYGPPIAVSGVPGAVYIHKGGDFRGVLRAGYEATLQDWLADGAARLRRIWRRAPKRAQLVMGTGFSGLADLVSESEHGKELVFPFLKNSTDPKAQRSVSLWALGALPPAGAVSAPAAPGGNAPTRTTTGAFRFENPLAGDTRHFVRASLVATQPNTLLLYDRLFHVAKTASSTATEAVTGVPTRYQSTTQGAQDSAEGNFLFVEVAATMGAVAHNWTVCLYEDQSGNTGATLPSLAGNTDSDTVGDYDHPAGQWFAPLASGDTGIKDLEQMQCSASVTGSPNFVIGHPIAWMPVPIANFVWPFHWLQTHNLVRIFDDACLALIMPSPASSTGVTDWRGTFTTVDG